MCTSCLHNEYYTHRTNSPVWCLSLKSNRIFKISLTTWYSHISNLWHFNKMQPPTWLLLYASINLLIVIGSLSSNIDYHFFLNYKTIANIHIHSPCLLHTLSFALTLTRTSQAFGGSTVTSSTDRGALVVQATAARHVMTYMHTRMRS